MGVQARRRFRGELRPLTVHRMVVGIIHLHRQKGSRPDMQRQAHNGDPFGVQSLQQGWGEMQAGCRSCDRPFPLRKQRLIAVTVFRIGIAVRCPGPFDIGWQGHGAALPQRFSQGRPLTIEPQGNLTVEVFILHQGHQIIGKDNLILWL